VKDTKNEFIKSLQQSMEDLEVIYLRLDQAKIYYGLNFSPSEYKYFAYILSNICSTKVELFKYTIDLKAHLRQENEGG